MADASAPYTLEELADAFDLKPRTARHYVENVLPPRHKTGRGRRALYGEDTWLCFAFVRKARGDGLTLAQIARMLAELSPEQVGKVVSGEEALAIVTAGRRVPASGRPDGAAARWQILYADEELQIAHRGAASAEQRAQVRMAAAWIRRLFAQQD